MPPIDRLWTPDDYARAAATIEAFAKRDSRLLPRLHGRTSGVVFAQVVDLDNVSAEPNLGMRTGFQFMEATDRIFRAYHAADEAGSFSHEISALEGFRIGLCARLVPVFRRIESRAALATGSEEAETMSHVYGALQMILEQHLTLLDRQGAFDAEDRERMAQTLYGDGLAVVHFLPPQQRGGLCSWLERVLTHEPSDSVRSILLRAAHGCSSE